MLRDLFRRLRSRNETVDPVFGPLRALGGNGPWEGSVHLPQVGTVDLLLDRAPGDPDPSHHHRLFAELSRRYAGIRAELAAILPTRGEVSLVCIDLRRPDAAEPPIELTFEEVDGTALHSVALVGWKPELVLPEG